MKNELTKKREKLSKNETLILIGAGTVLVVWLTAAAFKLLIPAL